jgi:hypothetical protein
MNALIALQIVMLKYVLNKNNFYYNLYNIIKSLS